ncbi:MAG: hypothetical protein JO005_15095, partial [Gammaproteobacteria bacterium]|nr:hypothetical protein [Gammaproteobacteria bacterium]
GAIADAPRHAAAFRPHVCVVDVSAFGGAAHDFARHVRSTPWGGQCLLLALGEAPDPRERQNALDAGYVECIKPPQTAEALEGLIARHLARVHAAP